MKPISPLIPLLILISPVELATIASASSSNDDLEGAFPILLVPFLDTKDMTGNSWQTGEPVDCSTGLSGAGTIWYKFTPLVSTVLNAAATRVSTTNDFAVVDLGIWTGSSLSSLALVTCDNIQVVSPVMAQFEATAGLTYYIQVIVWTLSGGGSSGTVVFALTGESTSLDGCANEGVICIATPLVSKIADVSRADAEMSPTLSVQVSSELGRVRIDGAGTFVEQLIAVVRINGQPDPSTFNQSLGPISTSYSFEQQICVQGACSFTVSSGLQTSTVKVGEIWNARLQVFLEGAKVTDVPFVRFVPV